MIEARHQNLQIQVVEVIPEAVESDILAGDGALQYWEQFHRCACEPPL